MERVLSIDRLASFLSKLGRDDCPGYAKYHNLCPPLKTM